MSTDRAIDAWLAEEGYELPEAMQRARSLLEAEGLTRPGKRRISDEKLPRARAALHQRFYLHCGSPECQKADRTGRVPVRAEPKARCEYCGGSDNRRAESLLLEACRQTGIRRLVVVGGSPSVRAELSGLAGELELRMVDGTERRTADRAKSDLEWADLVLVWGASELHHKVSTLYTQVAPPLRRKVVQASKRGVAALLAAAMEHLRKPR